MGLFAQINDKNIVENVVVIPDEHDENPDAFLRDLLGSRGRWVACEAAAVGDVYNPETGEFWPEGDLNDP